MRTLADLSICFAVVMAGTVPAMARPRTVALHVMERSLPVESMRTSLYSYNPATMIMCDSLSLSELSVNGDMSRYDEAYMMQLGRGHTLLSIKAESYMRLSRNSVVWGDAGFTTGNNRDIRWTDCVDYLKLAPYVLGDAVGGDMSTRRYEFGGGWATGAGRWMFGIHASYRASVDYRNRDPRVKTVVSDLKADMGAAYSLSGNYSLGLSAGIEVYNQNCDVDFYNPMNDIDTYTLTGLGTYYARFMGNTNKNSGYDSFGFNLGMQLVSADHSGWGAAVAYEGYRMEQLLRNFNNLTLGYSDVHELSALTSYRIKMSPSFSIMPEIRLAMSNRRSTENLFGNAAGGSYPKIGDRSLYRHDNLEGSVAVAMQIGLSEGSVLSAVPSVAYVRDHERYESPERDVDVDHIGPVIDLVYSKLAGDWLWHAGIGGSMSFAGTKSAVFREMDMSSDLGKCVMHNYRMLASDRMSGTLSAGASRYVDGLLVGIDITYYTTSFEHHGSCHGASATVSVKF